MARLLIYDAYENKVYTYNSLNENCLLYTSDAADEL